MTDSPEGSTDPSSQPKPVEGVPVSALVVFLNGMNETRNAALGRLSERYVLLVDRREDPGADPGFQFEKGRLEGQYDALEALAAFIIATNADLRGELEPQRFNEEI